MTRKLTTLIAAAAAFAIALVSTACGSTAYSSSGYGAPIAASTATRVVAATVGARQTSLGRVIVDGKGRTLYLFEKDTGKRSRCSSACAQAWPPLISRGKPVAKGRAKASLLSTSRRGNGSRQVTYGGHPLYRFAPDTAPGQTLGQGVDGFGALWWVVARSGNAITSSSSPGY